MDERTLREYYTAQFSQIIQQSHPGADDVGVQRGQRMPSAASVHLIDTLARRDVRLQRLLHVRLRRDVRDLPGHHWQPPAANPPINDNERAPSPTPPARTWIATPGTRQLQLRQLAPHCLGQEIRLRPTCTTSMTWTPRWNGCSRRGCSSASSTTWPTEPWVKAAPAALPANTWTNSDANTPSPRRRRGCSWPQVADRCFVLLKNADRRARTAAPARCCRSRCRAAGRSRSR